MKRLKQEEQGRRNVQRYESDTDSSDSDSTDDSDENGISGINNNSTMALQNVNSNTSDSSNVKGIDNVSIVFNDAGCPSIKHHAANFMLIPSIYEYNRFQPNTKHSNIKNDTSSVCLLHSIPF